MFTADIKVVTNAKKNRIKRTDALIKVYITAVPVKGKANRELIKYLSEIFNIAKSSIEIKKGKKSKNKTLLFHQVTDEIKKKLGGYR